LSEHPTTTNNKQKSNKQTERDNKKEIRIGGKTEVKEESGYEGTRIYAELSFSFLLLIPFFFRFSYANAVLYVPRLFIYFLFIH